MQRLRDIIDHKGSAVHTARPEDTVARAIEIMVAQNIGALLIVGEDGAIEGIFTERDYLRKAAATGECLLSRQVADVMTRDLVAMPSKAEIEECMSTMTRRRIRHIPVIDEGRLQGLVSIGDIVNAVIHEKAHLIDELEEYITRS